MTALLIIKKPQKLLRITTKRKKDISYLRVTSDRIGYLFCIVIYKLIFRMPTPFSQPQSITHWKTSYQHVAISNCINYRTVIHFSISQLRKTAMSMTSSLRIKSSTQRAWYHVNKLPLYCMKKSYLPLKNSVSTYPFQTFICQIRDDWK